MCHIVDAKNTTALLKGTRGIILELPWENMAWENRFKWPQISWFNWKQFHEVLQNKEIEARLKYIGIFY